MKNELLEKIKKEDSLYTAVYIVAEIAVFNKEAIRDLSKKLGTLIIFQFAIFLAVILSFFI